MAGSSTGYTPFNDYSNDYSHVYTTHNGNLHMSELFPTDFSLEVEKNITKGLERFYPKITPELRADLEAMYDMNLNSTFLISDRMRVGADRKGKTTPKGTKLNPYNLYTTEFTLNRNENKHNSDELFRLTLYFMIEFNKRVHKFNDAITIRVQTSPVNYYNIVTLKNKFSLNMDTIVNFLQHVESDYNTMDTNFLKFIVIESAGAKGKGNGNYNMKKLQHYKVSNIEPRRFLFNPEYTGYCGCISIVYGCIKQGLINNLLSKNDKGMKLVKSIKNVDYKSNKNFHTLYYLGKLLADDLDIAEEMTLFDFDKITSKYPNLTIVVYREPERLLYISGNSSNSGNSKPSVSNNDNSNTIYLQHHKNHFLYIKNIDSFSRIDGKHRTHCKICNYIFKEAEFKKHSCVKYNCRKCKKILFTYEEAESHKKPNLLTCRKCKIQYNETCYEQHLLKLCLKYQNYKKCDKCELIYNKNVNHECYKRYCVGCMDIKPVLHRCFLSPFKNNSQTATSFSDRIYAYDIESFLDIQSENALQINHNIAMIVCSPIYESSNSSSNQKSNSSNNNQISVFYKAIDFISFLDSFQEHTYFYAHNGKSYDSVLILHELYKNGKKPDKLIKNGNKIILMKYRNITFLDSINHINGSLRSIVKNLEVSSNAVFSNNKGFFPYTFFTSDNKDYVGPIPDKKYFVSSFDSSTDNSNSNNNNDGQSASSDGQSAIINSEFEEWYENMKDKPYNLMHECERYCIQDVLLLCSVLRNYRNESIAVNGIDPLKYPTISSYAMYVYRSKYLTENTIGLLNDEEHEFAQLGFYGGRTNSLALHKKWTVESDLNQKTEQKTAELIKYGLYMDVNSLYPTVQYYDNLPIGHPIIIDNSPDEDGTIPYQLADLIDLINNENKYCLVECDITCPKNLYIPVLVNRVNRKLMSTLYDKERIVYTSPELRIALKKGYKITKIYKLHMYATSNKIFRDYIDTYIKLKEESRANGDNYRVKISKLMLCSIWGKLAQKRNLPKYDHAVNEAEWNHIISEHLKNNIEVEDFYVIEDYMYYKYTNTTNANSNGYTSTNIALAGAITAYARCRLYEELDKLQDRVLYFDTDSIIYEYQPNKYNIPSGLGLGEWKQEGGKIVEFISIGPKSYACKYENGEKIIKCKGFKTDLISEEHYLNLIYNRTDSITYKMNNFAIKCDKIISKINNKILKLCYDKRIIAKEIRNGYIQTIPFGYDINSGL